MVFLFFCSNHLTVQLSHVCNLRAVSGPEHVHFSVGDL